MLENIEETVNIGYKLIDLWVKAVGVQVLVSRDFTPDTWVKLEPYVEELGALNQCILQECMRDLAHMPEVREVVLATYARDRQYMRERGCPEHMLQALAPQVF